MRISFGDLKLGLTAKENIQKAIETNWISSGPFVSKFENCWSRQFNYRHSIAMSSGTDADINACLALYDLGAERGDNVICPALTYIATANSILAAGFVPNFVDIKRQTLNIDADQIAEHINDRTRAIMVTHTMGKPCEMDTVMSLAKKHGLYVIEDSCESPGMKYKDQYPGKMGDIATFSFYTAHIVVAGEGGMCSTDNDQIADVLRSTRNHGRPVGTKYFDHVRLGINSKMTDLEAAVGLEGLRDFDHTVEVRRHNKDILFGLLSDIEDYFMLYREEPHEFISPHAFPIAFRHENGDRYADFYRYLENQDIECKTLFASVPTQQKAFSFMKHQYGEFPEAEYIGHNGLHFGIHQYLNDDDMKYVSDVLHRWVNL